MDLSYVDWVPPSPIPLRRGPTLPTDRTQKLAFMRGNHPIYIGPTPEGNPNTDRLAQADADNTQWAGAYRGSVNYPREMSVNNARHLYNGTEDSTTIFLWGMANQPYGVQPLSSRRANANFFASDPMQFGSVGGGWCKGIDGGGVSLAGMTPSGQWSFLTPGTPIVRPAFRQNYYGPINPTMSTKDFQASSIYNPLPAFGVTTPTLP